MWLFVKTFIELNNFYIVFVDFDLVRIFRLLEAQSKKDKMAKTL